MSDYEFRDPFEQLVSVTDEYTKLLPMIENSVLPKLSGTEALLDVGAGPGLIAGPLSAHFERTAIVEPDSTYCLETVEKILATGKVVTAFNGPWDAARFGKLQYDLIVCSHVLYFVASEEWDGFLQKMVPHIRPGGRMAIVLTAKGDDASEKIRNSLGMGEVGAYSFSAGVIEFAKAHNYAYDVLSFEANISTKTAEQLLGMLQLFPIMKYDKGSTTEQRLAMIRENLKDAGGYRMPYSVDIVMVEAPG